jgi:HAD superfamily hydrolase (TIGR01459 family)
MSMTEFSEGHKTIVLQGLSAISDRFDAAILDQWGVLHDGAKAPPGAIDAVTAMAAAGKRLVVLSNSARLGSDATARLIALGYDTGFFAGFVTSGETVRDMLRDRNDPFFAGLGRSVFIIARDPTLIEDLDYRIADAPETADFVLLGSSTAPELSLRNDHAPLLERAAARGLPLICANPDRIGVAASGLTEGPGALAAYYESLGGKVRYIGKPYGEVYVRARHMLGDTPLGRILGVGDSLEHDIAGGIRAGCITVLVAGGIHATDLTDPSALAVLSARYGATPDFVMPRLVW